MFLVWNTTLTGMVDAYQVNSDLLDGADGIETKCFPTSVEGVMTHCLVSGSVEHPAATSMHCLVGVSESWNRHLLR